MGTARVVKTPTAGTISQSGQMLLPIGHEVMSFGNGMVGGGGRSQMETA